MKLPMLLILATAGCSSAPQRAGTFDVHLHGSSDPAAQLAVLRAAGVDTVAVSTSWDDQQRYRSGDSLRVLHGLMFPCPRGKVPYSLQPCHADGREWPQPAWVERQVEAGKIDFLGEVLGQYYGISPSDPRMFPYYAIAERHDLPVGIHTGSAGPGHGSPDFREELGNPALLRPALEAYPRMRVWLMHAGVPFLDEAIALMQDHPQVHADLSVINNPDIVPPPAFAAIITKLFEAGLGDRIMFGTDNADVAKVRASLDALPLTATQKQAILHGNAARFFARRATAPAPAIPPPPLPGP